MQGAFEKYDWHGPTDLQEWLERKERGGEPCLDLLRSFAGDPTRSIYEFEDILPPREITNFYWAYKAAFEKLEGQRVLLVVGHCPEYQITAPADPEVIEPEDSKTLTGLVLSWVARSSVLPMLTWNMRHDCRKRTESTGPGYSKCLDIDFGSRESRQCIILSDVLLKVAQNQFGITIGATLSYSDLANRFVETIYAPRIKLEKDISQMNEGIAYTITMGIADAGMSQNADDTWEDHYRSLRAELLRGPGPEAGRHQVVLPELARYICHGPAISIAELLARYPRQV